MFAIFESGIEAICLTASTPSIVSDVLKYAEVEGSLSKVR